jgi:hypothetical protein
VEAVHAGSKAPYQNTGEQLTGYSGYIPELEIPVHALQARLKRYYQKTITTARPGRGSMVSGTASRGFFACKRERRDRDG